MVQAVRTTRQASIGRFRQERIERRDTDYMERQAAVTAAAEFVLELTSNTQNMLGTTSSDRKAWGDALRKELNEGALTLNRHTIDRLVAMATRRAEEGLANSQDRQAFVAKLKADVVRIVSEDFL